jgi:parvulin-like peptidyl-prolyl isomerase
MNRQPRTFGIVRGVVFCAACGLAIAARAAQDDAKPSAGEPPAQAKAQGSAATPPIAATIDGKPVFLKEIEVMMRKVAQARVNTTVSQARTQAEVLKQVINRRLAARAIEREGGYVSPEEVDKELESVKTKAASEKLPVEEFVRRQGVSLDTIRDEVLWTRGWDRYVERNISEKMEGYFKAHQKDFDGTLVRASHILLRSEGWRESSNALVERARKLREQILADELTFEQAAERFSAGPSRARGGDLGFFPRFGVMAEDFAKAAFGLKKGEISEPVVTAFGVHLIRVTDEKPGSKQWTEVLDQMRVPASVEMFEKLAEQEAASAKIEFTGLVPYFKPGTTELVMPSAAAAK